MIAIYTTFLRSSLVRKTLPTYLNFFDGKVLVLDQGKDEDGIEKIVKDLKDNRLLYYKLPFDCGLSYARNFGVKKAKELGEKYILLTADSIKLIEPVKVKKIISFLESDKNYAIVGLELKNRVFWHLDMELKKDGWYFDLPKKPKIIFEGIEFIPCDVVKNFFIGKIDLVLNNLWDEKLKLAEHEDFFNRLKIKGYKVFYTNYLSAKYINDKNLIYNNYRQRIYNEFMPKVKEKYGIVGSYFHYSNELIEKFREWKRKNYDRKINTR